MIMVMVIRIISIFNMASEISLTSISISMTIIRSLMLTNKKEIKISIKIISMMLKKDQNQHQNNELNKIKISIKMLSMMLTITCINGTMSSGTRWVLAPLIQG